MHVELSDTDNGLLITPEDLADHLPFTTEDLLGGKVKVYEYPGTVRVHDATRSFKYGFNDEIHKLQAALARAAGGNVNDTTYRVTLPDSTVMYVQFRDRTAVFGQEIVPG